MLRLFVYIALLISQTMNDFQLKVVIFVYDSSNLYRVSKQQIPRYSPICFFFRYFRYRLMVSCLLFFLLVFVPYVSVVLSKWCLVCNLYNNFDTFFRCLSLFVIVRACIVYKIALSPFVCLLVAHHSLSNAKWIPKTKQNHIEKFK